MKQKKDNHVFFENPYDLESIFESLSVASRSGKEFLFLDKLIGKIRLDPTIDTTKESYLILVELGLLQLERCDYE